jgi:hypothetical protein
LYGIPPVRKRTYCGRHSRHSFANPALLVTLLQVVYTPPATGGTYALEIEVFVAAPGRERQSVGAPQVSFRRDRFCPTGDFKYRGISGAEG